MHMLIAEQQDVYNRQINQADVVAIAYRNWFIQNNREEKVVLIEWLIRSMTEIEALAVPKLTFYL